jgi:hypothetical protein
MSRSNGVEPMELHVNDPRDAIVDEALLWRLHGVVDAARGLPVEQQSPELRDALGALAPYYGKTYPPAPGITAGTSAG